MKPIKHLSFTDRQTIETLLASRSSFASISKVLNMHPTTISKEIRRHLIFKKTGAFGRGGFNECLNRQSCPLYLSCPHTACPDFSREICSLLSHPPYVCNGCSRRAKCTLEKRFYSARIAHNEYRSVLSESRQGYALSPDARDELEQLLAPLIEKHQSLNHIHMTHKDQLMFSVRSLYTYVEAGLFSFRNIDLPRKVRWKPRKHKAIKLDRACRKERTYEDFLSFMAQENPPHVVQMDTVIGRVGGKTLLTMIFPDSSFFLAFLLTANTAAHVQSVFNRLQTLLGSERFLSLFPVFLTDNGSEFSDPTHLEFDPNGEKRCRIFYCDPSAPQQKGAIENSHTLLRRLLPKGSSFDTLSDNQLTLIVSTINSYKRHALNGQSPLEVFTHLYGSTLPDLLGIHLIDPDDLSLKPIH